jgi:ribosome biogenesis protein ERB1
VDHATERVDEGEIDSGSGADASDDSSVAHIEGESDSDIIRTEDEAETTDEESESEGSGPSAQTARKRIVAEGSGDAEAVRMHVDDYSSDDEAPKNTIGNVPLSWYADEDHIGYGVDGKKIGKGAGMSTIDKFLAARDDPNFRWTVYDEKNGETIVLSARDVQLIQNLRQGRFTHPEFDDTPDYIPYYTAETEMHPLTNPTEPKARFLPSKTEMKRVNHIVRLMKAGKWRRPTKEPKEEDPIFLMWGADGNAIGHEAKKGPEHIPAPKIRPPGHAASYRPPDEYLMSAAEEAEWHKMHPSDRPLDFIPRKYDSLRHVPAYSAFLKERFERCLDLYLCPRVMKKRLNVDPDSLLPKLPDPSELRPFPTSHAVSYKGHTGRVRAMCVDPTGQYLATGSDDCTVRMWEIETGRELACWRVKGTVHCVAWNPNPALHILAVAADEKLLFINTGTAGPTHADPTFAALSGFRAEGGAQLGVKLRRPEGSVVVVGDDGKVTDEDAAQAALEGGEGEVEAVGPAGDSESDAEVPKRVRDVRVVWRTVQLSKPEDLSVYTGVAVEVKHHSPIKQVAWHHKGDYIASVCPGGNTAAVSIHQLSKRRSQHPFGRKKGQVQAVVFHPRQPLLFVANQRTVRVYNLVKQELVKKLISGAKWISSIDIHPTGDHVLVGTYDRRMIWFDAELSNTAYKTLKYHKQAVRSVAFHKNYPLFASAGDDGKVHIFHGRVFNDFVQNPLIVPVKIIKAHAVTEHNLGTLSTVFHPTQPWVFTAGADKEVHLWQNIP